MNPNLGTVSLKSRYATISAVSKLNRTRANSNW